MLHRAWRYWYYLALCPVLAFLLLTGNCVCTENPAAPERTNPNDPEAPNYVPPPLPPPPVATVSNLRNNPTLSVDSVIIRFAGNEKVDRLSYYLKNVDTGWSVWDTVTVARYTLLDEGVYTFYVRGRSDQMTVGPSDSVHFTVNAITGPSLVMRPKRGISASIGDTLRFDIMAEEVANVMQTDLFIGFNATLLGVIDVRPGSFFSSTDTLSAITLDTTVNAVVNIFTGFPTTAGASGSGVLATILFQAKAQGNGAITLADSCKLLSPSGVYQTMTIHSKVNTTYIIE
jgi:hypothetical protein